MKRTVAALAAAAGLGTGLVGCMGSKGERTKVEAEPAAMTEPAPAAAPVANAAGTQSIRNKTTPRGQMTDPNLKRVNGWQSAETGPQGSRFGMMLGHGGILPTPGMGAPGAVAAVGAGGPSAFGGVYPGQRTSVAFVAPAKMKVALQDPARGFTEIVREDRFAFNFPQGAIYRLKVGGIPTRPGKTYYPTLELYPATVKTVTFLSHSTVPVGFSDEDLDQVAAGNMVVKVIYLPDPQFQDLAAAEELVSTRLEAGVDPIAEANRRGTILAIVRIGNIDLEDESTPAMDAPPGFGAPAPRLAPPPPPMRPAPGSAMKMPDSLPAITVPPLDGK